jgi:hypothetical protein
LVIAIPANTMKTSKGRDSMNRCWRLFYRGFASHDHIDVEDGDDQPGVAVHAGFESGKCPNCAAAFALFTRCAPLPDLSSRVLPDGVHWSHPTRFLYSCLRCGWWQVRREFDHYDQSGKPLPHRSQDAYTYHAILENVDISSNDVALSDLTSHLRNRWEDRRFISAGKAEDLVASILREITGCDVFHATANVNAPDGGIDLFVPVRNGMPHTAVQVKRRVSHDVEPVDEVRNFVGALVVEGYDKGIFVTTASRFSKGAKSVATNEHLSRHRLELDLIDGQRLLEMLHATSEPKAIELPASISLDMLWRTEDGRELTTSQVLGLCR